MQDREPDLDLIEPGGVGRGEVEMHIGVTLEPAVVLRLVGAKIIEDNMDGSMGIGSDDRVHEVKELDAPAAALVGGHDFTGRHFERGKQGRGAVPLVIMALPAERPLGNLR